MISSSHLLTWESFEGSPLTSILPLAKRHNCDEEEGDVSLAMRISILEGESPEHILFNPFCFFLVLPFFVTLRLKLDKQAQEKQPPQARATEGNKIKTQSKSH